MIAVSSRSLEFQGVARSGQSHTLPVVIVLYGAGSGQRWSARAQTFSGGVWLSLSPLTGEDDATLQVTATVGKLTRGTYTGAITISAEAQNSPVVIQVIFNVRDPRPAALELSATALRFTAVVGIQSPGTQEIVVWNQGEAALNWRAAATTTSGGNWLSVSPVSGSETGRLAVRAEVGSLGPGEYRGLVTVSSDEAVNSPLQATVTLAVERAAPVIRLSAEALRFAAGPEVFQPAPQTIAVSNAGYGTLSWRASAVTFNGGAWLAVTPGTGTVLVSADGAALPSGTYTGRVTISAEGAANSPALVPVTLTVTRQKPEFRAETVVNAASLVAGPVTAEEIVTIFGERLATEKGPTTVRFDGVRATLLFFSSYQLNLVVPREVAGKTRARMVVEAAGLDPAELEVAIAETAPGMFTVDGRRAAALNEDNQLNTPENRAPVGSVVQLFATGLGRGEVRVSINMIDAGVRYAGPAPGFAGLGQINVEIPREVGASEFVRVVVRAGAAEAPPVFIAVGPPSGSLPP